MQNITLDAIPDLSDTQVIVYSRWDRSPDIIEDQVAYPLVTAMLGVPRVKVIRGFSDFGYSFVYIIFEDGTDIYRARSRTIEYLSNILPRLPQGVQVELARDETAIGWVFQYALVDTTGKNNLADLRSMQDWQLWYELQSVPGVAEVAPIGGFVRRYQVQIDPNALVACKTPLQKATDAIKSGNNDVGGRLVEFTGREYMVRGKGYIRSIKDIENTVVGLNPDTGTPVLVRQLGRVVLGPDIRRGIGEMDGGGEAVGAIWLLYFLGYNTSIAVWVGLIALMGVDAETSVFMLLYLDLAFYDRRAKGMMKTKQDLREAIVEGAVKRLRPKFMTVAVMFLGLVPIMWSTGAGSDVMKRIAAPMVGGIFTSFIMELMVYPAIYEIWRWHFHVRKEPAAA